MKRSVWIGLGSLSIGLVLFFAFSNSKSRELRGQLPDIPFVASHLSELREALADADRKVGASSKGIDQLSRLAKMYHANGYYQEAVVCYRLLLDLRSGNAQAHYLLFDAMKKLGDPAAGLVSLRKAIELAPSYTVAKIRLGDFLLKNGKTIEAVDTYEQILQQSPSNEYALLGLARHDLRLGNEEEARLKLERSIVQNAFFGASHRLLARIYDRRGEARKAAIARERAELSGPYREPKDPWYDEIMVHCYDVSLLAVYADARIASVDPESAIAALDRAEALRPEDISLKELRGRLYAALGRERDAIGVYQNMLALGGDSEAILPLISEMYRNLGDMDSAVESLKEGLREKPGSAGLLAALAQTFLEKGSTSLALNYAQRAVAAAPENLLANRLYGRLLWERGMRTQAIAQLEKVCELSPTDYATRMNLAQTYFSSGDFEAARETLQAALDIEPGKPEPMNLLASTHLRLGNQAAEAGAIASAFESYQAAIELNPQLLEAYANWAILLAKEGRTEIAIERLEAYLNVEPNDARAQELIEAIGSSSK